MDGTDGRVEGNDGRVEGIDGRETDGIPVLGLEGRLKLGLGRLILEPLLDLPPPPPPPRPRASISAIGINISVPISRKQDAVLFICLVSKSEFLREEILDYLADLFGAGGRFTIVIGSVFSRTSPATIRLRYCHVTISGSCMV